jgi:small subunit ribosomal protein S17
MSKIITGTVSSNKGDKTIVIAEHVRRTHPLYRKQYTTTSKFIAHDEKNECNIGDKVVIEECRPISARKRFRLKEIVQKAALSEKDLDVIESSAETEVAAKEGSKKPVEKKNPEDKS